MFLLEKSVCFGSDPSYCFPLKDIVTVGTRTYKSAHFTLMLYIAGSPCSYDLKFLPNAERNTILRYFRRKNIPVQHASSVRLPLFGRPAFSSLIRTTSTQYSIKHWDMNLGLMQVETPSTVFIRILRQDHGKQLPRITRQIKNMGPRRRKLKKCDRQKQMWS